VTLKVGFIGTGPDPDNPVSGESFAQAYRHAPGYEALDQCELVGCADLVPEHAEAFADRFDIPGENVYEDYEEMFDELAPDVVSVCTPIPTHADIVLDCIDAGVDAVHCEKPMASTWGDARRMAEAAWRRDVQLTFNHQRRFGRPFRRARELIDGGEIGDLRRVECSGAPLYETGIHFVDLCNYLVDESPVEWVMGQIDYREENVRYGLHSENQSLALWQYENGVHGLASTGTDGDAVDAAVRALGTEGVVEIGVDGDTPLRIRRAGEVEYVDCGGDSIHGPDFTTRAIADLVSALEEGHEPETSARRALNATETIMAAYESSRRHGRVDLPLDVDDNPLVGMVEDGSVDPVAPDEGDRGGEGA
jgi:predicted dehydrogenase